MMLCLSLLSSVQIVSLLLPDLLAPGAAVYDMGQEKVPPMLTTDQGLEMSLTSIGDSIHSGSLSGLH